jgi:hypothetical protein
MGEALDSTRVQADRRALGIFRHRPQFGGYVIQLQTEFGEVVRRDGTAICTGGGKTERVVSGWRVIYRLDAAAVIFGMGPIVLRRIILGDYRTRRK